MPDLIISLRINIPLHVPDGGIRIGVVKVHAESMMAIDTAAVAVPPAEATPVGEVTPISPLAPGSLLDWPQFGQMLRSYRERLHLTRRQLADELKLAESTLRNLEKGRHTPSAGTLARLQGDPRFKPLFQGTS